MEEVGACVMRGVVSTTLRLETAILTQFIQTHYDFTMAESSVDAGQ